MTFRGRDLLTGLPRSVEVGGDQIREALEPSVAQIVEAIKDTIEETPPELVADIMDQGIVLAGGGALLAGLDRRVAEATQMPVHIADDPLTCVVRGTGRVLEELDTLERVLVTEQYTRAPRWAGTSCASLSSQCTGRPARTGAAATGLWFAAFMIASLLMLLASSTEPARPSSARDPGARPGPRALSGIGNGVAGVFGTIGEIDRLRSENDELRIALAGAEQRIAELEEAARENAAAAPLLGIAEALDMDLLPARVIEPGPVGLHLGGGLDAGTEDGVRGGHAGRRQRARRRRAGRQVVERHRGHRA